MPFAGALRGIGWQKAIRGSNAGNRLVESGVAGSSQGITLRKSIRGGFTGNRPAKTGFAGGTRGIIPAEPHLRPVREESIRRNGMQVVKGGLSNSDHLVSSPVMLALACSMLFSLEENLYSEGRLRI
jgi:hypothetical protein